MQITKDTTLAEAIKHPEVEDIMKKHGVPCMTCPMAKFEMDQLQIGQVCQMYGIDLEKLISELNKRKK